MGASLVFHIAAMPLSRRRKYQKKADVAERPKAFHHVGLLFNELPGRAEPLFI